MAINIKEIEEGLQKLYTKLMNAPEKGFIIFDYEQGAFSPSLQGFTESNRAIYENPDDIYHGTEWQQFLIDINLYYGYGPEIESNPAPLPPNNMSKYEKWYKLPRAHLTKDEKYYVVRVPYERITQNPAIQPFFVADAALEVPGGVLKMYGSDGLLQNEPFVKSAKIWALQKLANDLGKAINTGHVEEVEKVAFLPVDSITQKKNKDGIWETVAKAESWHIEQRPAEYQDLFLKMMLDRNWVESLPLKNTPCADLDTVTRTVMLFMNTLEQDLEDLAKVLNHFQQEILNTDVPVSMSFNGKTSAQKISKISALLAKILELNDKPLISTQSEGALQFGFTEDMRLQYIAFSELPECLCDEKNINAYILENGIDELKTKPPLDSQTVNGFLFYMPDILRKYKPYLKEGKNRYLFSTQESWLTFVKSYVVPEPQIMYNTSETKEAFNAKKFQAFKQIVSSAANLTKQGAYLRDPTILMAPDVRARLLGTVNAEVRYGGDTILMNALTDEIYSIEQLWDRLLNKVPIFELIKIAVGALVKCTPDSAFKQSLCESLKSIMPVSEIRSQLYPCLRTKGAKGEVAIAHLETKISGRLVDVYKQARAIYPERFPLSADVQSEATMSALNDLYCSDPQFSKMLGRPPNDLSEEMLADLEDDAKEVICNCILTGYGPVQEILGFIEDTKDDVVDIVDSIQKSKSQGIEGTVTFPFHKIYKAFHNTKDPQAALGEAVKAALLKSLEAFLWASCLVLINKVKESVLGGLAKDICNAFDEPWNLFDPTEAIMKSKLYEDMDFLQLKKTIEKMGSAAGLAYDVTQLVDGLKELGRTFTPSELKRLFTSDPGDNSADDVYKKAAQVFKSPADSWAVGTPSSAAISAAAGDFSAAATACPPEQSSFGAVKDFVQEVGTLIDPIIFDTTERMWEDAKGQWTDMLCNPEGINVFEETVDPEAIKRLAAKGQEDLIADVLNALPLLDPQAMQDMIPPIFCGPCDPKKVGMTPLVPTQSTDVQLGVLETLNNNLFKMVNSLFNINISAFKPILFNDRGVMVNFASRYIELAKTTDEDGFMPTNDELAEMSDKQKTAAIEDANQSITATLMKEASEEDATSAEGSNSKYIAGGLLNSLATAAATNLVSLTTDNPEFRYFTYSVPGPPNKEGEATESSNQILLIFNFSNEVAVVPGYGIAVPMLQIKVVVYNTALRMVTYEWPPNIKSANAMGIDLKDYQITGFEEQELFKELTKNIGNILPSLAYPSAFDYVTETNTEFFTNQFPVISNLVFETILTQAPHHDLFIGPVFNKIPFTDEEVKNSCLEGIATTPILNTDKLGADIDKTRQQLECITNMFAKPDALQIANVYALQKLMIKVCIVEEYLKNIFIFGFMRMSDILEQDFYMPLFMKNLISSVETSVGQQGYDKLLEYSVKIINGRQYLGEQFPNDVTAEVYDTPLGPVEPRLPPEECLKILIREAAGEINDILDGRIQGIIDPAWMAKFTAYKDIDDPEVERTTKARLLEYAILSEPEFWSPSIFPSAGPAVEMADVGALTTFDPDTSKFPLPKMRDIGSTIAGGVWSATNATTRLGGDSHWPTKGAAEQPWSGGIFLQPYIKIHSTLENKKDTTAAKQAFWDKVRKAWVDKHFSEQHPVSQLTVHDQPAYASYKPEIDILAALINKIDNDGVDSQIFEKFWELFDLTDADPTGVSMPPTSVAFTRLISSYIGGANTGGNVSYTSPYYYWSTPGTTAEITAGAFVEESLGVPEDQKYHWLNRGLISSDLALNLGASSAESRHRYVIEHNAAQNAKYLTDYAEWARVYAGSAHPDLTFSPAKPTYENGMLKRAPLRVMELGARNSSLRDTVAWPNSPLFFSTITAFGVAKEVSSHGFLDLKYANPSTLPWLEKIRDLADDLGYGWKDDLGAEASGHYDWDNASSFYYRLRDVIFDSAYDLWLDFTLGMRLNLLFPIPDEDLWKIDWSAYFAIVAGGEINKYNEEKTFIWEKSPTERYLCLPMENTEYRYSDSVDISYTASETNYGTREVSYPTEKEGAPNIWRYVERELTLLHDATNPAIIHTAGTAFSDLGQAWTIGNDVQDGGKPTLWALCRAMQKAYGNYGDKILHSLKRDVMVKAMGAPGSAAMPNKFLGEILPVKEIVTVTALMYRYYMEGAYPGLDGMFSPTKSALNKYITQMLATIEGDYQYVDSLGKEVDPEAEEEDGPTDAEVASKFFKLVVQMMANLMDPTWKTPWFLPGPLTPVGILAKSLATKWTEDEDADPDPFAPKEPCGPPPGEEPQTPMGAPVIDFFEDLGPPSYDGMQWPPYGNTNAVYTAGGHYNFPGYEGWHVNKSKKGWRDLNHLVNVHDSDHYKNHFEGGWEYIPWPLLMDETKKRWIEYDDARLLNFPKPPPGYQPRNDFSIGARASQVAYQGTGVNARSCFQAPATKDDVGWFMKKTKVKMTSSTGGSYYKEYSNITHWKTLDPGRAEAYMNSWTCWDEMPDSWKVFIWYMYVWGYQEIGFILTASKSKNDGPNIFADMIPGGGQFDYGGSGQKYLR